MKNSAPIPLNIPSLLHLSNEDAAACAAFLKTIDSELENGKDFQEIIAAYAPDAPDNAFETIKVSMDKYYDKYNKVKNGHKALSILEEDSKSLSIPDRFCRDLNLLQALTALYDDDTILSEEEIASYSDYLETLDPDAFNEEECFAKISVMENLIVEHNEEFAALYTKTPSFRKLRNSLEAMSAEETKAFVLDGEHSRHTLATALYVMAMNDEIDIKFRKNGDLASVIGATTAAAVEADTLIKTDTTGKVLMGLHQVFSALILTLAAVLLTFGLIYLYAPSPLVNSESIAFFIPLVACCTVPTALLAITNPHQKLAHILFRPIFNRFLGVKKLFYGIHNHFTSYNAVSRAQLRRAKTLHFVGKMEKDVRNVVGKV